jgi:hypothetical protein
MRDDLHRTLGVSRRWSRVLRYAKSKADRQSRLPNSLTEAVRLTLSDGMRASWLSAVRVAVRDGSADLFGNDRLAASLRHSLTTAATPLEREVAECLRGRATFQASSDLFGDSVREVAGRVVERSCEQLVAKVRVHHPRDAGELRGILHVALSSCDIGGLVDPAGGIAPGKKPPAGIDLDELVEL